MGNEEVSLKIFFTESWCSEGFPVWWVCLVTLFILTLSARQIVIDNQNVLTLTDFSNFSQYPWKKYFCCSTVPFLMLLQCFHTHLFLKGKRIMENIISVLLYFLAFRFSVAGFLGCNSRFQKKNYMYFM